MKRSFGPDGPRTAGAVRVAEFRRPKFRVATASAAPQVVAGDPIESSVEGSLLAGGPMARAPARWSVRATPSWWSPPGARWEGWEFVREAVDGESPSGPGTMPLLQG